jgi:hypothetical protein
MKLINRKRALISILAVSVFGGLILSTSREGLRFQLDIAFKCKSRLWMDALIYVCECRYGNEPKFQRIIGLAHFDRAKQEWDLAFNMLSRIIDSMADSDTKITPLITRAEMWETAARLDKALEDYEKAKAFILLREARGEKYMEKESSYRVDRHIQSIRKQLESDKLRDSGASGVRSQP